MHLYSRNSYDKLYAGNTLDQVLSTLPAVVPSVVRSGLPYAMASYNTTPVSRFCGVFVRLRPHHLEMPSVLIIQVSRHVGHANLIFTCCPALSSFSTAEINSVFYRSNDASVLCIVQKNAINLLIYQCSPCRITHARSQVPASTARILSQGKPHAKAIDIGPTALTRGTDPLAALFLRYLERVQP
jgi:hypothetical protein